MITRNVILSFCALLLLMVGNVSAQPERAIQFQKYIVKEGETPGLIAEKFNVKKKDFLMLNNFPSNIILKAGEEVLIRRLNEDDKPIEEAASGGQYAARNGAAISASSNNEETEPAPKAPIKPYQPTPETNTKKTSEPAETRNAPTAEPPKAAPAPAPSKSTQTGPGGTKYVVSDNNYHIVEKGQTFYRIALIYGLTVDKLKELNNMTNTTISVGQKLRVK